MSAPPSRRSWLLATLALPAVAQAQSDAEFQHCADGWYDMYDAGDDDLGMYERYCCETTTDPAYCCGDTQCDARLLSLVRQRAAGQQHSAPAQDPRYSRPAAPAPTSPPSAGRAGSTTTSWAQCFGKNAMTWGASTTERCCGYFPDEAICAAYR